MEISNICDKGPEKMLFLLLRCGKDTYQYMCEEVVKKMLSHLAQDPPKHVDTVLFCVDAELVRYVTIQFEKNKLESALPVQYIIGASNARFTGNREAVAALVYDG